MSKRHWINHAEDGTCEVLSELLLQVLFFWRMTPSRPMELAQRHGVTRQKAAVLTFPVVRSFYATMSCRVSRTGCSLSHTQMVLWRTVCLSVLKQKQFSMCKNNDTGNGSGFSAMLPANHIWLFYRTAMRICVWSTVLWRTSAKLQETSSFMNGHRFLYRMWSTAL